MTILKQIFLLALAACLGLVLVGCQPSDPNSPRVEEFTAIAVTPNPVTLEIGGVQALTVTGTLSDGKTYVVNFGSTFASSAPAVAKVDAATGYVTALAAGTANITATHTESGKTATTAVTVSPLRILSIAVSPATVDVEVGANQALTVTATYNNQSTGPVTAGSTFASSDPTVATVDAAGIVTGVAEGKATITARHTATGKTSTAAVSVTTPIVGFPPITFDTPGTAYTLTGFGGAEDSTLVPDPVVSSNTVAKVVKSATAELWAGTTVSTKANSAVPRIPFSATETKMTVRVYSPKAGIVVRLKVEDAADPTHSAETEAVTTKANAWETLTFDFAKPASGTSPLNLAYTYNKISIFFAFGTTGAAGGAGTYYFDDVTFVSGSSGNTGTCAAPNCTDFSAAGIGFGVFENPGGGTVEIAKDPKDAANDVVKFVKKTGDNDFFGTTITGLAGPATLTTTNKTVTLRVFSPAVGTNFLFKLEGGPGGAVVEKDVATTVANAWETLSFDLSAGVAGTYATVVIFPNGRSKVTADKTMYVDELKFPAGGGSSGGPIVFASGFATNNRTVEGGEWGFYSGNFTNYTNTYAGGGFVDGPGAVPAADSYVYLVVATSAPTTDGFMGIFTAAPGYTIAAPNAGVTLSGQTTLKIELGMATEWFQQPGNKQLTVRLVGSQVYSNGAGGFCQILVQQPVTPTTADLTAYTIQLSSMNLAQACNGGGFTSGVTSLAEALAKPIGEIHVQAVFPQVNTTVKNGAGTEYPTGFTRGSVSFE